MVRGPLPDRSAARALAREWSVIQIGRVMPAELAGWRISVREFREELQWAVIVEGEGDTSVAVRVLLKELAARGVAIHDARRSDWLGENGAKA